MAGHAYSPDTLRNPVGKPKGAGYRASSYNTVSYNGSVSRPSPSPVYEAAPPLPSPHAVIPITPEPVTGLLKLTILATGHGPERRLEAQAEPTQTIAELCVQSHPALVMAGRPVGFTLHCNGRQWVSTVDGMLELASLDLAAGSVVEVRAEVPGAETQTQAATPEREQQASNASDTATPTPAAAPTPTPTPTAATPQSDRKTRRKKDTVSLTLLAKERRGSERTYDCSVSFGEKLVSLCKRCNLTEPVVSARNSHYKGYVVRHATTNETWTTKGQGRKSVREMKLCDGDTLVIEMDWDSLQGSSVPLANEGQKKAGTVPTKRRVSSVGAHARVSFTAPPAGLIESPEDGGGGGVGGAGVGRLHGGFPLPGSPDDSAYHGTLHSPRHVSPSPIILPHYESVNYLPPTLSPEQSLQLVQSPQVKAVTDSTAWQAFVEALSTVLHEQDLLLVSAETVRDLIRHYGFDSDPIVAAKIELQWKRLSGQVPPESPRKRRDPRHIPHGERMRAEGRRNTKKISDEAARRMERGQLRRQQIVQEQSQPSHTQFTSLPFGGGIGESPSDVLGRRPFEAEQSKGRKRAMTPPTHTAAVSERRHNPARPQQASHADPNTAAEAATAGGHDFMMYSRELRSVEFSDNRNKQVLVAPGRRLQLKQRNEGQMGEGMVGEEVSQAKGRGHYGHDTAAAVCNPNDSTTGTADTLSGRARLHSDVSAAVADPNRAGGKEPMPSQKCYTVGPDRTTVSCNPNAAGSAGGHDANARPEGRAGLSTHAHPSAGCNPNNVSEVGHAHHLAAERAARIEGDRHFANITTHHAGSDPNSISTQDTHRTTRRGHTPTAQRVGVSGCNPNSMAAGSGVGYLHGPAGAAGAFSPGLQPPSPSSRKGGVQARSNPNTTTGPTAAHIAAQGSVTASGPAPATRKMANVDHNQPATLSPKTGGRRRHSQHPANSASGVSSLMRSAA